MGWFLSQCTYRCVVLPDLVHEREDDLSWVVSICTYRCVVLPDELPRALDAPGQVVSMHLQVRAAP